MPNFQFDHTIPPRRPRNGNQVNILVQAPQRFFMPERTPGCLWDSWRETNPHFPTTEADRIRADDDLQERIDLLAARATRCDKAGMWITFSGSIVAALLPLILIIINQSASDDTKASNATNTTLNGVAAFIAAFIAAMIVINGHFKDETLDIKRRALASQDLLFPPAPRQQLMAQREAHPQQQMQQVDTRHVI